MISIQSNASEVAQQLGQIAAHVPDAADKSVDKVAEKIEQSAGRFIDRIYERPTNGWERSGDLRDGLEVRRPDKSSATLEIVGRAATYARPRNDLDRAGRDGETRHNPFFDQAHDESEAHVVPDFEAEFKSELGL